LQNRKQLYTIQEYVDGYEKEWGGPLNGLSVENFNFQITSILV